MGPGAIGMRPQIKNFRTLYATYSRLAVTPRPTVKSQTYLP